MYVGSVRGASLEQNRCSPVCVAIVLFPSLPFSLSLYICMYVYTQMYVILHIYMYSPATHLYVVHFGVIHTYIPIGRINL